MDFGKLSIKNAARDALSLAGLKKLTVDELRDRAADIYSIDVENVQVALSNSVPSLTLLGAEGWDATHHIIPKISLKSFIKLAFRPPKTIPRAEISAIAENMSAAISDTQIAAMRMIVMQLIPQFEDHGDSPAPKLTFEDCERKLDPIYTDSEINRMRSKEAFLLALQLDVVQVRSEITTNTHGNLSKGTTRFLHVNADGLKFRTGVYAYNYWAEAELHGATIKTADDEPLLISDSALPIVKISFEDKLAPVPIGPGKRPPPRVLKCDIGKVRVNVPERIWEVVNEVQKMVQFEPPRPTTPGSELTLPSDLYPQDETLILLDVEDVQVALWENQPSGTKKIVTLDLETLHVKFRQASPDASTDDDDDVMLRKMSAQVKRFTCRHHLHENLNDEDEMVKLLDFGDGTEPASLEFTQFDRTSPNFPGWVTAVNADITQDILLNLDQDPLSHILRYIIKVQAWKGKEPIKYITPEVDSGLSEFKFDVTLKRIVVNLFKPGTFRSRSKDHISIEIGNITARDLVDATKKLPTLAKISVDPITIHSKTFQNGTEERLTILEEADIKVDALLEKVLETDSTIRVGALTLRPYQLRMVLDLLGVVGQTMPLAMEAKDALTGPPPVVVTPPSSIGSTINTDLKATITGKHTLHLDGLDLELVSARSGTAMLGLHLPAIALVAQMTSDGDTSIMLDLQSFNLFNPQSESFRDIIPPARPDGPHQLTLRAVLPQDKSRPMEVILTLVDAEIILDIEAIVLVLSEVLSFKSELHDTPKSTETAGPLPMFELSMQTPKFTVLEDSADPNSNAITVSAEFIAMDTTDDSLIKILDACMYQRKMYTNDEPLLFVDHFGVDAHKEAQKWKGTVDPIVLRVSPKDIRLALSMHENLLPKIKQITDMFASENPVTKAVADHGPEVQEVLAHILTKSHYQVQLGGLRLVFIGDMPEIPILDMKVKDFTIDMQAWNNFQEINVLTSTIGTSFNMYNFAKSKWEPVIEPWEVVAQFGLHQPPEPQVEFNVSSGKRLEFDISTRAVDMVALLQSMMARILSKSPIRTRMESIGSLSRVSSLKPLSSTAPYRIVNTTGLPIEVWSDKEHPGSTPRSEIDNDDAIPWRFDSWRSLREHVNIDTEGNLLNFKLKDTPYNNIERVPVNMEANRPYRLKPSDTKIPHHIMCEVKLGSDNIKEVILRSTYLIENASLNEIEVMMIHQDGEKTEVSVEPGDHYAVPVLLAQSCRIRVRPPREYGYEWSDEPFIWSDFLKREPTRTIRCRSHAATSFNLLAHAVIDKSTPLASQYPFMTLRISTPLTIVNLLPYQIKYHLYDKRLQDKFTNTVDMGDSSPVHSVELSHLLLLSVEVAGTTYEGSEYSVINADDPREFRREGRLNLKDKRGGRLHLGLHYLYIQFHVADSGISRIQVVQ